MRTLTLYVSSHRLVATWREAGEVWSRPIAAPEDRDDYWAAMAGCLAALRETVGRGARQVRVLLLPPLVRVRRIELPRLRTEEIRLVLTRDVDRYLIMGRGAKVIGFARIASGGQSPEPILLAAASAWLVEGLVRAIEQVGWSILAVAPVHPAWAAPGGKSLVAAGPDAVELLFAEAGHLHEVRRLPAVAARLREAAGDGPPPVAILADGHEREQLVALAEAAGLVAGGTGLPMSDTQPAAAPTMELLPGRIVTARVAWARRLRRRLWVATAALAALGVGLARWDLSRELAAVQQRRAAIRGQVAEALAGRGELERARSQLQRIANAEASAPRWTAVLGTLAERLPQDAFLTGFQGVGDTLALEGTAGQAAGVFETLQRMPGVAGLRANAPIRQETGPDELPVERFTLTAWIRPPADTASKVAP